MRGSDGKGVGEVRSDRRGVGEDMMGRSDGKGVGKRGYVGRSDGKGVDEVRSERE